MRKEATLEASSASVVLGSSTAVLHFAGAFSEEIDSTGHSSSQSGDSAHQKPAVGGGDFIESECHDSLDFGSDDGEFVVGAAELRFDIVQHSLIHLIDDLLDHRGADLAAGKSAGAALAPATAETAALTARPTGSTLLATGAGLGECAG